MTYDDYIALGEADRMRARLAQLVTVVAHQDPMRPSGQGAARREDIQAVYDEMRTLRREHARVGGNLERLEKKLRLNMARGATQVPELGEQAVPFKPKP